MKYSHRVMGIKNPLLDLIDSQHFCLQTRLRRLGSMLLESDKFEGTKVSDYLTPERTERILSILVKANEVPMWSYAPAEFVQKVNAIGANVLDVEKKLIRGMLIDIPPALENLSNAKSISMLNDRDVMSLLCLSSGLLAIFSDRKGGLKIQRLGASEASEIRTFVVFLYYYSERAAGLLNPAGFDSSLSMKEEQEKKQTFAMFGMQMSLLMEVFSAQ